MIYWNQSTPTLKPNQQVLCLFPDLRTVHKHKYRLVLASGDKSISYGSSLGYLVSGFLLRHTDNRKKCYCPNRRNVDKLKSLSDKSAFLDQKQP